MIERKTGLLYELLLRGNFDDGANLGAFKGGHLVEAEAVVETETGEIISYRHGNPVPIPEAQATQYFGKQFAAFNAGFDALGIENAKLAADLDVANSQITEVRAELKSTAADLAVANSRIGLLMQEAAAKNSELAAINAELASANVELAMAKDELAKARDDLAKVPPPNDSAA